MFYYLTELIVLVQKAKPKLFLTHGNVFIAEMFLLKKIYAQLKDHMAIQQKISVDTNLSESSFRFVFPDFAKKLFLNSFKR